MEFFSLNLYANRALRMVAIGLMLSFSSLSIIAHASSDVKTNGLKPDTRESVRNIGQALLLAKRSYKVDENINTLRSSIMQTQQLVNELTQPIMTQHIQLTQSKQSTQVAASVQPSSQPSGWHQAQASKITQLRAATAKLRSLCQSLQGAKSAKTSSSLFDSVTRFFTGKANRNKSTKFVFAPVTSSVLTYLEQIDSKIEVALALPAVQRQQRLHELAEELNITDKPIQTDNKDIITPTLSNRTQHRRSW